MAGVKACCTEAVNLQETSPDPHRSILICQVCGCRHFRFRPNQAARVSAPEPHGPDA